jgi:hypothetical protein
MPKGQGSKRPLFIDVSVLRVEKWRNAAHTENVWEPEARKDGQDMGKDDTIKEDKLTEREMLL